MPSIAHCYLCVHVLFVTSNESILTFGAAGRVMQAAMRLDPRHRDFSLLQIRPPQRCAVAGTGRYTIDSFSLTALRSTHRPSLLR